MTKWLSLVLLAACTPGIPPPATQQDAIRANLDLAQLNQGRELLLHYCGKCHDVPVPGQRDAKDWPAQVTLMAPKAGIDASQKALIEQYLVTMAAK
ncbi:MAG: hypothetical protein ABI591_26345 [Kofleriaceae bacterium]